MVPAPPLAEFDLDAVSRLRTAVARLSRGLRATPAGTGLTPTQISVLFTLVRRGESMALAELAAAEQINPTMLSRVVAGLAEAGLVVRHPHPADRRAALVEATDDGARLRRRIHRERSAALQARLERLPAEQRAALLAALPALEALADQPGAVA